METFPVSRRRQKVMDQVMNARHGLSHREATATDLLVHYLSIPRDIFQPSVNMRQPSVHELLLVCVEERCQVGHL